MKVRQLVSAWTLLSASSNHRNLPILLFVQGKKSGGGGGGGGSSSFGGGGSAPRPSSPSYNSAPRPSSPSYNSNPSNYRPSNPTTAYRPSVPTPTPRPPVKTPTGSIPYNSRSPYNPNPSYKPLSNSGAPTLRSGGGGFGSKAKSVVVTVAKAAAFGLAVGAVINIVRGAFLYGGRYSSPYCRGDDVDRYASGRCPVGYSTASHKCAGQVPLCGIPESVRSDWNVGPEAPPRVEVSFDGSVCSFVPATAPPAAANNDNTTNTNDSTTSTVEGVDGTSGLSDCVSRILSSGGCDAYNAGSLFQYDESNGGCGCCSTPQVVPLGNFSAAVYSFRTTSAAASSSGTTTEAASAVPQHCISGATIHYPSIAASADATFRCDCGSCTDCGNGASRYLDWSGPFAVSDAEGEAALVGNTGGAPLYDPVETCVCGMAGGMACEEAMAGQGQGGGYDYDGYGSSYSGASAATVVAGRGTSWAVGMIGVVLFVLVGRR